MSDNTIPSAKAKHFIEQKIEQDIADNLYNAKVTTRFPPEPNGYLHIGHAKSICLNFGMAAQYKGVCHLRFDDTNPTKEEVEFIEAIKADVSWLGFKWDALYHTADYFEKLYQFAIGLIQKNLAFVCDLSGDEIRETRGSLTAPGQNSPYRERSVEENLELFHRMRQGDFPNGACVLRAKIDMHSGNINLRDPVMYRILHTAHPHVGKQWCIYPTYDYAHSVSDALENITHSLCTLEFQDHKPLYDWYIAHLFLPPFPQQIEFSRLNLSHTVTSKRKLKQLVDDKIVSGWDDPRMPTLVGMRRRGFTPNAIQAFCKAIGISKSDSLISMSLLEEFVRNDLNRTAPRAMCVLKPLKLIIASLADGHRETLRAQNHPNDEAMGYREIAFTKEIYIEQDDFMEIPVPKYFRLSPGQEVRLRHGYIIKCESIVKDPNTGEISAIIGSHDPKTLGKNPEGRKVKGVIHWVSASENNPCQVRCYDRLFKVENPGAHQDWDNLNPILNPESAVSLPLCYMEKWPQPISREQHFQFERIGYFVADLIESTEQALVFNQVIKLRDNWS